MSTANLPVTKKETRGRKPVDSEEVAVRFTRPDLDRIDQLVEAEGLKGRPEAVRRLVQRAFAID